MNPPLSISQQQKRIQQIIRQKNFGRFSDRLGAIIQELWMMAGDDVLEHIANFLSKASGKFTLKDFEEINAVASQSMRTAFGTNLNPIVQQVSIQAYSKGLDEIRAGLSKSFSLVDSRAVEFVHRHHMYWSLEHYDSHVTERVKRLADTAIQSGLSRRNAGKFFERTLGQELERDRAYWDLMADAITTRSRSFSNIAAFEESGIERYVISIVDNHRTSDICRYLGGKEVTFKNAEGVVETVQLKEHERRFDVADAARVRDRMIEAKTPEEAKEIMPWRSPKTVLSKFPKDLARGGVVMPPFHGNCRSTLDIV